MADLGLGSLIELKRQLLSSDLASRTTWDVQATAIGKGVAKSFDKYCNRIFARGSSITDQFTADRASWVLSRYPVETISALDMRSDMNLGWVSMGLVNTVLQNRDDAAGIIHFGAVQGGCYDQIRVTYAGGYYYDSSEDASGSLPSGATALPDDIKTAWFMQSLHLWECQDPVGGAPSTGSVAHNTDVRIGNLSMVPEVVKILEGYVRMNLT